MREIFAINLHIYYYEPGFAPAVAAATATCTSRPAKEVVEQIPYQ